VTETIYDKVYEHFVELLNFVVHFLDGKRELIVSVNVLKIRKNIITKNRLVPGLQTVM
jgi:hypothetical protein